MSKFKIILICSIACTFLFGFVACVSDDSYQLSIYTYSVHRLGGNTYYINDYTLLPDGSIMFEYNGSTYHLVEYRLTELE